MAGNSKDQHLRLQFEAAETLVKRLERGLDGSSSAPVTIDMSGVERIDPAGLRTLRQAADIARRTGAGVYLEGAQPEVYKAVQVAGLGSLITRIENLRAQPLQLPPQGGTK